MFRKLRNPDAGDVTANICALSLGKQVQQCVISLDLVIVVLFRSHIGEPFKGTI